MKPTVDKNGWKVPDHTREPMPANVRVVCLAVSWTKGRWRATALDYRKWWTASTVSKADAAASLAVKMFAASAAAGEQTKTVGMTIEQNTTRPLLWTASRQQV